MLDIELDYTSLQQAVADLKALEDELGGGGELRYNNQSLMLISKGDTSEALNQLYTKMALYQLELVALVGKTIAALTSIGMTFATEENASMQESGKSIG